MMASIPNMRSTPLPSRRQGAVGRRGRARRFRRAAAGVPGQPLEAVALPPEAIAEPVGRLAAAGGSETGVPATVTKAKRRRTKADTHGGDCPKRRRSSFLSCRTSRVTARPSRRGDRLRPRTPRRKRPGADPGAPAGKSKARACDQDGEAGRPAPDGAEAPAATDESREIEAAVKGLAAAQAGAGETGRRRAEGRAPIVAPARTAAQVPAAGRDAGTAAPPVAIQRRPCRRRSCRSPRLSAALPQPEPAAAEKTGTVDGTRTTELAVERKLDLARDTEWLDRLARDIAQAGANDSAAPLPPASADARPSPCRAAAGRSRHRGAAHRRDRGGAPDPADAQPRLAAEARAQGVRIAETHVDLSGSGRHAPGDPRRQDEARQTPLIRTARGAGHGRDASARSSARARLDRYA